MSGSIRNYVKRALLLRTYSNLSIGKGCQISQSSFGKHVRVEDRASILGSTISDYSYVGPDSVVCGTAIGKFCSIAGGVHLGTGSHPSRGFVSTHPIFYLSRPSIGWDFADKDYLPEFGQTRVGHDVWIGARAIIRDGLSIGDGAIVGAGAVVVKDLQPYGIYAGVPARLIRYRFDQKGIDFLADFKWWDKDVDWLAANFKSFHDIDNFITSAASSTPKGR